jgi:phosphatidylinositol alpha-mannosyltransferase
MMRIGLVCPYDLGKPGGVQAQVLGLGAHLVELGEEVSVIGPGVPDDLEGVDLGSTVTIPGNASTVPISLDPRVGSRIARATRDIDLLHVHEPLMPVVSLTALRVGKPVVATFHAAPGRWGSALYNVVGSRLRRVLGPNVKRVTAVSRTAAVPLPADLDVEIIPNGVDVSVFSRDAERQEARVCFLGRDEKRKGLDVLLEAWPLVETAVPSAELVVMGADRGWDGITWKGRVDDATKAEVLASSAIYVAPNLGGESFGIVLVEAMAAGTPVVASDLASFRDVGDDSARYFATGDPERLATSIIDLLGDPGARHEMSSKGRARVAEFDWRRVTARYRSVYEAALS